MNENQGVGARKRRSGEEVKRLVVEFEASGSRRDEFCRTRGMALSTLWRHLKKHGAGEAAVMRGGRLVAVELSGKDPKSILKRPAHWRWFSPVVGGSGYDPNLIRSH
jgi:hypothetical protein